jgi:hypothetical protein
VTPLSQRPRHLFVGLLAADGDGFIEPNGGGYARVAVESAAALYAGPIGFLPPTGPWLSTATPNVTHAAAFDELWGLFPIGVPWQLSVPRPPIIGQVFVLSLGYDTIRSWGGRP